MADLPIGMRAICRSYGGRVADGLGTPWQPRRADSAALEATAIPADWWNVTLVDYLVTSSAAASSSSPTLLRDISARGYIVLELR